MKSDQPPAQAAGGQGEAVVLEGGIGDFEERGAAELGVVEEFEVVEGEGGERRLASRRPIWVSEAGALAETGFGELLEHAVLEEKGGHREDEQQEQQPEEPPHDELHGGRIPRAGRGGNAALRPGILKLE
ncbi:MAG: hypothetical protein M5U12_07995 [Verrucomicrobia bacterium]|nr:hypothetical protein [Verrucomicrobiota bacterium]